MGKMIKDDANNYDLWSKYISDVVNDDQYKVNAMKCSLIMKSKDSRVAVKLAIDAVERFISWGYNASHLQPIELSIPYYEYFLLDAISVLVITFGLIYITLRFIISKMS